MALERQRPGLEVHVLLGRKHRPSSADVPAHWKVEVALPPDYFYYMAPSRFWPSLLIGAWRVFTRARKADLVHSIKDYPHSLAATIGARAAGRPCIATGHGTYTVQPLLSKRHRNLAIRTYSRVNALIAVSGYTQRKLLEHLPPGVLDAERIAVIPNAVDAEHYAGHYAGHGAARDQEPDDARPWRGKRFTLTIGELKERKGVHLALAAWCRVAADVPDLHHFVVGRADGDKYEDSLHRTVREAGLESRVHFLGNVAEADKVELLSRAEVFLHTPVTAADGGFEGFGIVYLEAAAAGTPAIGTLDCGAEDAIEDGVTGRLVAQEVGAVEEALRTLVCDAQLRERMGQAGLEHARASSWNRNADRVLELYDAVLSPGSKGGAAR
jgi:phosphatidylinositol alpha-1,6-mannosyltransferase